MSSSTSTRGTVRELFKFGPAQIMRMDLDEEFAFKVIRLGEFIVNLVTGAKASMIEHAYAQLALDVCMDGGSASMANSQGVTIIRIGRRSFAIGLPGLFYGLQFSPCIQEHTIDTLARVFNKFGTYKDLNENGTGYPFPDNESDFWNKLRSLVFPMAEEELSRLGYIPRMPSSSLRNQASGNLRMIRMYAATDMISNVLVSGSVMSKHIFIQKTIPEEDAYASIYSCALLVFN